MDLLILNETMNILIFEFGNCSVETPKFAIFNPDANLKYSLGWIDSCDI